MHTPDMPHVKLTQLAFQQYSFVSGYRDHRHGACELGELVCLVS